MGEWVQAALVFLALTNLVMLGSSRLQVLVRMVTLQGIVLGLLPLMTGDEGNAPRRWLLAAAILALKGIAFPLLLLRAQRDANLRREVEPFVGYMSSLVAGLAALSFSFWLSQRLPLPPRVGATLVVPIAMFTFLVGLFLIVTRRKALTQVIGYLAMENGIYAFGVATAIEHPLLIEFGMLLDVFVAVFLMGIILFHISREFDHIDSDRLSALHDLPLRPHERTDGGSAFQAEVKQDSGLEVRATSGPDAAASKEPFQ